MSFSYLLIVAMDAKRGIGKDGDLPWQISADLKYFKRVTTETEDPKKKNAVVMGRKTWDSLPERFKPLPNRKNIVITRNEDFKALDGVAVVHNFEDIQEVCAQEENIEKVFVIGGKQIFQLALNSPFCSTIYLTAIDQVFDCDTFLPSFEEQFDLVQDTPTQKENDKTFSFQLFNKKIL